MNNTVQKRARGSIEIPLEQAVYIQPKSKLADICEQKTIADIYKFDNESSASDVSDLEQNMDDKKYTKNHCQNSKKVHSPEQENILKQLNLKKTANAKNRKRQSKMDRSRRKSLNGVKIKTELELATDSITIIRHKFKYKPFGFSVAPDEFGMNAVVTKVTTKEAINAGILVGFVICKIKQKIVLDMPHETILEWIKNTKLPTTLSFSDRGYTYNIVFGWMPLGFSIMKDENNRNAKVCRIGEKARKSGVKVESFLMSVNGVNTWGIAHCEIIGIIKSQKIPIVCKFRMCPALKRGGC